MKLSLNPNVQILTTGNKTRLHLCVVKTPLICSIVGYKYYGNPFKKRNREHVSEAELEMSKSRN